MALIINPNQTAGTDNWTPIFDRIVGQDFVVAGNGRLETVRLILRRVGTVSGNLYVAICEDDDGFPGNVLKLSDALDASTIAASPSTTNADFTFSGDPQYLTNGNRLHIVLLTDTAMDVSNTIQIGADSSSPSYTDGLFGYFETGGTEWEYLVDTVVSFYVEYENSEYVANNDGILPAWDCDCTSQIAQINNIISILQATEDEFINEKIRSVVAYYLGAEPSEGAWKTAWVQSGRDLPLVDGANLLWYNTTDNNFGADMTSFNNEVYPAEHYRIRGNVSEIISDVTIVSDTPTTTTTFNPMPTTNGWDLSFTLDYPSWVRIVASATWIINTQAGTNPRINYFLNSVNQREALYPSGDFTRGIEVFAGPNPVSASTPNTTWHWEWLHPAILQPGSYTLNVRYIDGTGGISLLSTANFYGIDNPLRNYVEIVTAHE